MNNPANDPNVQQLKQVQMVLVTIQRLSVKVFNASNLQNLIFIILNDTYQVINYDRSFLFRLHPENVEILGISGQKDFNLQTELAAKLKAAVKNLKDPGVQRVLKGDEWINEDAKASTVYWIPIPSNSEILGLWLEKFEDPNAEKNFEGYTPLIKEMLVPAYSAAWEKASHYSFFHKISPYFKLKNVGIASLLLLLLMFLVPIRLRIVVPAEVIAEHSFVVTAPLEGVIEKVDVEPGQEVKKGQVLFNYDNKIPAYKYQAIQKEVDILQAEHNQNYALSTENDPTSITKLAILDHKLKKSKVDLDYAKQQLSLLVQNSPIDGLVSVDNPDDWRGKPVKVGEKIMTISNQGETKLKMWIPERDNITFAENIPIEVFLNSIPTKTFQAKFLYISPEVKAVEGELPSFEAEGEWLDADNPPKLGLKGSAVIYGEKVSIFYYFLRKPINAARKFLSF